MKTLALSLLVVPFILFSQPKLLDPCSDTAAWKTFQSAGVLVKQQIDGGIVDPSLRFDVQFTKGSGYGGVFRNFDVPLPENYQISFMMKATVPVNNFEIKISSDSLGETIWWENNKNYTYPSQWKRIIVKKRHIVYAWGPHAAPSADKLERLELVVTAGSGGRGSVWIKDLELIPIPRPPSPLPAMTAASSSSRSTVKKILPGVLGSWKSKTSKNEWVIVDFGYHREFGGVAIDWDRSLAGLRYDVLGSVDGQRFDTLYSAENGKGGRVLLFTPEAEARYVKIAMKNNRSKKQFQIGDFNVIQSESLSTANNFFEHLAAAAPKGFYPRYFLRQQSYWTVVGVPIDTREALLNEDGMLEVDKQRFSIEPFVALNGELLTWANGKNEQWLEEGYIPIPTVKRTYTDVAVTATVLARGEEERSSIMARYVVKNISSQRRIGSLYLALRPFQVNPSSQWLNFEGGFARTEHIVMEHQKAVAGEKTVFVSGNPSAFGASTIDQGDIVEQIAAGKLSAEHSAYSPSGMASASFQYDFDLQPNDSLVVIAAVPFTDAGNIWHSAFPTPDQFGKELHSMKQYWESRLNTVQFALPKDAQRLIDIVRSNLGYILINKDKFGFQPGSRSYERSWIRDGSMTSDALLKLGIQDEPKKYLNWYSSYQYENGMVPCVVDTRGPDPVPENDSHGELIFGCMEYFRFTNDTTFLRERWNTIAAAVKYIQFLRAQRMTKEYELAKDEKRSFYGLVTESISHEGYSDKARHSYWDNFFALKGLKDAAAAAAVLGMTDESQRLDSITSAYRSDLYRSIALSMKDHIINYIPGCAELGDFDPTSTSIALFPAGEMKFLPQGPLHFTYGKYFQWFTQWMNNEIQWDVYTPYEIRTVGTFVYLGQKERAHTLLDWFLRDQRPQGWNHWAEVVHRDKRHPRFIGDMPHTWVGSDYINSIRAMFAYELDDDHSLVIAAGLKDEWVKEGLSVRGLPTHYGTLSYSISHSPSGSIEVSVSGGIHAEQSPILIPVTLLSAPLKSVRVNGTAVEPVNGYIRITHLPATVQCSY
jgi:hypothetical protein